MSDTVLFVVSAGYMTAGMGLLYGKGIKRAEALISGLLGGFFVCVAVIKLVGPYSAILSIQVSRWDLASIAVAAQLVCMTEGLLGVALVALAAQPDRALRGIGHCGFVCTHLLACALGLVDYCVQYWFGITTLILPVTYGPQFVGLVIMAIAVRNLRIHRANRYFFVRTNPQFDDKTKFSSKMLSHFRA